MEKTPGPQGCLHDGTEDKAEVQTQGCCWQGRGRRARSTQVPEPFSWSHLPCGRQQVGVRVHAIAPKELTKGTAQMLWVLLLSQKTLL